MRLEYYIVEYDFGAYRYVAAYSGIYGQYIGISAAVAVTAAFVKFSHKFFYQRLTGRAVCESYEQPEYENYGYGDDRYRFRRRFFACHYLPPYGRAAPGYFFIVLVCPKNFKRGFFRRAEGAVQRLDFSAANPQFYIEKFYIENARAIRYNNPV